MGVYDRDAMESIDFAGFLSYLSHQNISRKVSSPNPRTLHVSTIEQFDDLMQDD